MNNQPVFTRVICVTKTLPSGVSFSRDMYSWADATKEFGSAVMLGVYDRVETRQGNVLVKSWRKP